MAHARDDRPNGSRSGFSLAELSFVVVLIGVLTLYGAPRLLQSVERSNASKSFKYLGLVRAAQEQHLKQFGRYAAELSSLKLQDPAPYHFHVGKIGAGETGDLSDSWSLTLTRSNFGTGYGSYSVTFTQDGYDPDNSTIESEINPQSG